MHIFLHSIFVIHAFSWCISDKSLSLGCANMSWQLKHNSSNRGKFGNYLNGIVQLIKNIHTFFSQNIALLFCYEDIYICLGPCAHSRCDELTHVCLRQGLSQDPSYLSFGQVFSLEPPVRTGKNFYDDFSILTFGV